MSAVHLFITNVSMNLSKISKCCQELQSELGVSVLANKGNEKEKESYGAYD